MHVNTTNQDFHVDLQLQLDVKKNSDLKGMHNILKAVAICHNV